jgi:hypothetical protein
VEDVTSFLVLLQGKLEDAQIALLHASSEFKKSKERGEFKSSPIVYC